jgi:hypothetical protein
MDTLPSVGYKTEFIIWNNMIDICTNPKNPYFRGKGAKGLLRNVKVCDKWLTDFQAFYKDLGPMPSAEYALDVHNETEDFSPENCAWAHSMLSEFGVCMETDELVK